MRVRSWLASKAALGLGLSVAAGACSAPSEAADACTAEPMRYAAIDAAGRAFYEPGQPVRFLLDGCAFATLRDGDGRVVRRVAAGHVALDADALRAGPHDLALESASGLRAHLRVAVGDAHGTLSAARADEEPARTAQEHDDALPALEAWEASADLPSGRTFPSLAARRLRNAAYFAHRLHDLARMAALLARSEARLDGLPDPEGRASLLYYRGLLALERQDLRGADPLLEAAAHRAEQLGARTIASSALEAEGFMLERLGRFDAARHALERARLALGELAEEPSARARHAINTSWVELRRYESAPEPARLTVAERALESALELATDPAERADAATNLAWLALRAGRAEEFARRIAMARALDPGGHGYGAPYWPWLTGEAALVQGDHAGARVAFASVLARVADGSAPEELGFLAQASLAELAARTGDSPRAREGFRAATRALFLRSRAAGGQFGALTFALGQRPIYERAFAFFVAGGHHDEALRVVQEVLRLRRPARGRGELRADRQARYDRLVAARFETAEALRELASQEGLVPAGDEDERRARVEALRAREQTLAGELVTLLDAPGDAPPPDLSELGATLRADELLVVDQGAPARLFLAGGRAWHASDSISETAQRLGAAHVLYVSPFEGPVPRHATALEVELVAFASLSRVDDLTVLRGRAADDAPPGRALVVADTRDDLPHARREGSYFGALLAARVLVGRAATHDAVVTALLASDYAHIAGHALARPQHPAGDVLLLAGDSQLSALDVALLPRVPSVLVLGTCRDRPVGGTEPMSAELSDAFLDAGARLVISARRSAGDAENERFLTRYGAALREASPREALRRASAALRAEGDATWDLFTLRGVP